MATNKWDEILSDRSTYSDDQVIKLADGTEFRLGDVRPSHMMDRDYRQKTTLLARQREEFEQTAVQRMQALQEGEAQLRAIAADLMQRNPRMTQTEVADEMEDLPGVKRLRAEIDSIKSSLKPIADTLMEMKQGAANARQQYVINEHRKALIDLKAQHPDLDEAELITYARDNMVPNLKKAWTLMNHDKIVDQKAREVRETAFKEGYEKAKGEITVPPSIPLRSIVPARTEPAPKNMREAMDQALRDPEVMGPLMGRQG